MIGYKDIEFRGNDLWHGEKKTGYSIQLWPRDGYGDVFWKVRYSDGVFSKDFYNNTWARENCRKLYLEEQNKASSSLTGALE